MKAGGLVGNGCVGHALLAGDVARRHRALFDRPHRLTGDAIEDEGEALLGELHDGIDRAAVDA